MVAFGRTMLRVFTFPIPTVAAVTGHAIAGGAMLAFACDLRFVSEGPFRLHLNEVAIGLAFPTWAIVLAQAAVPPRWHTEAILHARPYSPEEAFERHLEGCTVCRDELAAFEQVVQALPMASPQHPAPKRLRRGVLRAVEEEPKSATSTRPRLRAGVRPAWVWRGLVLAGACAAVALAIFAGLDSSSGGGVRVSRAHVAGVAGSASVRLSGGRGELIVRHFSPPPRGDIYELWLKRPRSAPAPP